MGTKLGGDDDAPIVDINVTPLVDIVLVLLIIFMVTATYIVTPSIKVNLPEAATGEPTESSSLGLHLSVDGQLSLDGTIISETDLRTTLRRVLEQTLVESLLKLRGISVAGRGGTNDDAQGQKSRECPGWDDCDLKHAWTPMASRGHCLKPQM